GDDQRIGPRVQADRVPDPEEVGCLRLEGFDLGPPDERATAQYPVRCLVQLLVQLLDLALEVQQRDGGGDDGAHPVSLRVLLRVLTGCSLAGRVVYSCSAPLLVGASRTRVGPYQERPRDLAPRRRSNQSSSRRVLTPAGHSHDGELRIDRGGKGAPPTAVPTRNATNASRGLR